MIVFVIDTVIVAQPYLSTFQRFWLHLSSVFGSISPAILAPPFLKVDKVDKVD